MLVFSENYVSVAGFRRDSRTEEIASVANEDDSDHWLGLIMIALKMPDGEARV